MVNRCKKLCAKLRLIPALGVFALGGAMLISPAVGRSDTVVVASKLFSEQYILASMVGQVVEAKTALKVRQRMNLGSTGIVQQAMIAKKVDIYVEYTYTGWIEVLKHNPDAMAEGTDIVPMLKKEYKEKFGIEWVALLGFQNSHVLTTPKSIAKKYGLTNISDIKGNEKKLRMVGSLSSLSRKDAFPRYIKGYNLKFPRKNIKEVSDGLRYQALVSGKADIVLSYSTDAQIHKYDLMILRDDKNVELNYQAGIVVRSEVLEKYADLRAALMTLSNAITVAEMQEMNYRLEVDGEKPEKIAEDFLKAKKII